MDKPSLVVAVWKLMVDGERAGFTPEQMIELLEGGIPVRGLLELIRWRLEYERRTSLSNGASGNWVM